MPTSDVLADNIGIGVETPNPNPRKFRVQLDFAADDFQELNELTAKLGLTTRAELFRNALIALRWMYKKKLQGYTIAAVSPERRFLAEPDFPFLERITAEKAAVVAEAEIAAAFEEAISG